MKNNNRSARITITLPPAQKTRWLEEAEKRHWTLTSLIEVAVQELIERDGELWYDTDT